MIKIFTILMAFIIIAPANAYIGPGTSGGLIATILGILGSILLAIFGILYYPIKRFLKNRKKK
tara:strand:+ start:506 stop:694 length:189 start_codon:yes stop_codon:yes gene_type:complete